jgi:catechol 2,3-dioxygenase-like lactoylglutathione lyase family enzyme
MIASGVHHLSFAVSDLERSRRFYEGVLGLETIERPDLGLPGAWYGAGNAEIHLIQTPDGADVGTRPASITPLANHNAFAVSDYQATVDHFKRAGVDVLETSAERGQLWVRDPDGNVLEFIAAG